MSSNSTDRVILGIDPGTNIMGYGIIHQKNKKIELIAMGVVDMQKMSGHYNKLKHIFEKTIQLIDGYNPDELAIEAPFYGKNIQSMLKLGRAQGAAIAAALSRTIPIYEYAPRKIKVAITGSGSASKEQVAVMLEKLLKADLITQKLDATDGLAAAMCHFYQRDCATTKTKKPSSWKDFVDSKNIDYPGKKNKS